MDKEKTLVYVVRSRALQDTVAVFSTLEKYREFENEQKELFDNGLYTAKGFTLDHKVRDLRKEKVSN